MPEQWVTMFGQGNSVTIESGPVTVRPGLGRHQLAINLVLRASHASAYDRVLSVAGRVDVTGLSGGGGYIGTAHRTSPQRLFPNGKSSHDLLVDIESHQLRAIEQLRNGGFALNLQLELFAEPHDSLPSEQTPTYLQNVPVSREDWLLILEQTKYRQTMLVELAVPDAQSAPELVQSLKHFNDAHRRLLEGQYRLTVEALRQTLASLVGKDAADEEDAEGVLGTLQASKKKAFEGRLEYAPRYELARQALKFLADLGAHPEVTETTPAEARSALTMVAGLLQWYAAEPTSKDPNG